jgi:hypothetical protein
MNRIAFASRRRLAIWLAAIPFHRLTLSSSAAGANLNKRRRLSSWLLIPLANAYLRCMGSSSVMLSNRQWHLWEAAVGAARVTSDRVATPKYPGKTLRVQLLSELDCEQKMDCFTLALSALSELHQTTITWEGRTVQLSHGDATADNVCVDLKTAAASWFDFDTRHRLDLAVAERRADDLRALVYSSAVCLSPQHYPCLLQRMTTRAEPETLAALHTLLPRWSRPNTFQLAQAPLDYDSFRRFTELLGDSLQAAVS